MTNAAGVNDLSELCRLTILADHTQVDLALPTGVPLALLIPELVSMIDDHRESATSAGGAAGADWTLGRLGQAPLDPAGTLASHGVHDGDLLVLQTPHLSPPPPLFDDLMHNVASIGVDTYRRWTPIAARVTGSVSAVCLALIGSAALLHGRSDNSSLIAVAAALFVATLLVAAGAVVARVYRDGSAAVTLWGCSLPPAFTAGALIVPGPLGAPSMLLGSATCGAVAVLATRTSGVGVVIGTTVTALAALTVGAATLAVVTALPASAIGAVTTAVALILLAAAPRCAMLLARLPLPPVPSPGAPLDEESDLPTVEPLPSFVGLEAKAERARRHLTGLVAASGASAATSAVVASDALGSGIDWPGTLLAVATAAVLMLRGRTYASLAPAVVLIGCGTAIFVLLLAGAAVTDPDHAVAVFGVATLGVGAALAFGVVAPTRAYSPVQRRAVELIDYAAIAAVLPLVCWVSGLFAAMRGL